MSVIQYTASSRHRLTGIISGLIAATIWGLWPVITRFGVTTQFTPDEIVVVRFLFAGIVLLPYYFKNKVYRRVGILPSLLISTGAGAVYVYVSSLGLKYVPAGHLGVVETGTMLALSALGGVIFLKERKTIGQITGYFIVFSGMLLISWQSLQSTNTDSIRGDLLLVLGGILWALYTLLTKKWEISAWDAVATVAVWSLAIWVPLLILYGNVNYSLDHTIPWIMQGIGQGIIAAVLGLWFYSIAVNNLGAGQGSLFGALVPVIAVLGGFIFLGEPPTTYEVVGVTLTTVGIFAAVR